jgi:hypothetical protein
MRSARLLLPTLCLALLGCDKDPPPAGGPAHVATTAQAGAATLPKPAPSASAAPSVTASAAPSAIASAAPSATASAGAERTPEPELAEWGKAREITVKGSGKLACETKMVREWLRVMCVNRNAEDGTPTAIAISKGRHDHAKGENLRAVNDIITLIMPVVPGTDVEADFKWSSGGHALTVRWPEGKPVSDRIIAFDYDPAAR